MRCLALVIAYDGTAYHGFQSQCAAHGPTIQGSLEETWYRLFSETLRFIPAGRTDAGVHAAGQVVSFRTSSRIPTDKIGKAMNSLLPRDIRILEVWETEKDFSARINACWKRYDYWVDNRRVPDVFVRRFAYHEPVTLNLEAMRWAAQGLEGCHNFQAFAAAHGASRSFERTLSHCHITEERGLLKMSFVGDGFLYNMVRIMAGTLVAFGRKTQNLLLKNSEESGANGTAVAQTITEAVQGILISRDRARAGGTLAAHGLILTHVEYQGRRPSMVFEDLPVSVWEDRLLKPRRQ